MALLDTILSFMKTRRIQIPHMMVSHLEETSQTIGPVILVMAPRFK